MTNGGVSCQHLGLHKMQILLVWLLPHFCGLFWAAGKVDALSICWVFSQRKTYINWIVYMFVIAILLLFYMFFSNFNPRILSCTSCKEFSLSNFICCSKYNRTIRWSELCVESDPANHVDELCRDALIHCFRFDATLLFFLELKELLQCSILHCVHLKVSIFEAYQYTHTTKFSEIKCTI